MNIVKSNIFKILLGYFLFNTFLFLIGFAIFNILSEGFKISEIVYIYVLSYLIFDLIINIHVFYKIRKNSNKLLNNFMNLNIENIYSKFYLVVLQLALPCVSIFILIVVLLCSLIILKSLLLTILTIVEIIICIVLGIRNIKFLEQHLIA